MLIRSGEHFTQAYLAIHIEMDKGNLELARTMAWMIRDDIQINVHELLYICENPNSEKQDVLLMARAALGCLGERMGMILKVLKNIDA